jgi:uncharacterized protein YidB (DUF937 family)
VVTRAALGVRAACAHNHLSLTKDDQELTMGLLDSVLGGVLGGGQQQGGAGALINIVAGMLANSHGGPSAAGGGAGGLGGLSGLAEQFQKNGMGDVMNSWIGKGENLPIAPDQLGNVLGGDLLGKLTQQTGMGQGDLLGQLSQLLPQMVDKATPDGAVPAGGLGDIGSLLGKLGGLSR